MRRDVAATGLNCPTPGSPCFGARTRQVSHTVLSLLEKTASIIAKLEEAAWGCLVGRAPGHWSEAEAMVTPRSCPIPPFRGSLFLSFSGH